MGSDGGAADVGLRYTLEDTASRTCHDVWQCDEIEPLIKSNALSVDYCNLNVWGLGIRTQIHRASSLPSSCSRITAP